MAPRSARRSRVIPMLVGIWACATTTAGIAVPAGTYLLGSDRAEREWAYAHAPAIVAEERWYDRWERPPERVVLSAFRLDAHPVTQREYAAFVRETGHRPPHISEREYREQGFLAHAYEEVLPYLWHGREPPADRLDHPVVLVSRDDAAAYCAWRGARLPSEAEWEAACRGKEGHRFPWGDSWRPERAHHGADGTAPVIDDSSLDILGNVFEWTASDFDAGRATLKGCSWDDDPGTCRCAFRHGRPPGSRHILIGFRCAADEAAGRAPRSGEPGAGS